MRHGRVGHRARHVEQPVCGHQAGANAREGRGRGGTRGGHRREDAARTRLHRGGRRAVQGPRDRSARRPGRGVRRGHGASRVDVPRRRGSADLQRARQRADGARRPTRPTRSSSERARSSKRSSRSTPTIPASRTTSSTPTTCRRSRRGRSTRRAATRRSRRRRRTRSTCRRTRSRALGYWRESIESNLASAAAARAEGAAAEELHAMDYLVYAYLQLGRTARPAISWTRCRRSAPALRMPRRAAARRRITAGTYGSVAIPARYALEREDWAGASRVGADPTTPYLPAVAVAHFARALGAARAGQPDAAAADVDAACAAARPPAGAARRLLGRRRSRSSGRSASAWVAWAQGRTRERHRAA